MITDADSIGSARSTLAVGASPARRPIATMASSFLVTLIVAGFQLSMTSPDAAAQVPQAASSRALPTLQLLHELERPATTTSVVWSSDGTKLAAYTMSSKGGILTSGSISGKLITVWTADGRIFREIECPDACFFGNDPLAFAADNKQIVATPWLKSNALAFLVFDVESGTIVREIPGPRPDGGRPDNATSALVTSPDQMTLAVIFGTGRSQPIGLYSTRDWSKLAILVDGSSSEPLNLAFSSDGSLAVADLGGKIRIYDLASKRPVHTIDAFPDGVISTIAFNPGGSFIAVGSSSGLPTYVISDPVRVFRVKDGARVASYAHPLSPISSLAWSPDGRLLAFISGYYAELHLWDPLQHETSERTVQLAGAGVSLAFSPHDARLAVAHGNRVAIYSITP